ncbi:MAG: triose-phosphate isomerase [Limisphaerales bacterium]
MSFSAIASAVSSKRIGRAHLQEGGGGPCGITQAIICVGETLAEREGALMEKVLETQVTGSLAGLTGRTNAGNGHRL